MIVKFSRNVQDIDRQDNYHDISQRCIVISERFFIIIYDVLSWYSSSVVNEKSWDTKKYVDSTLGISSSLRMNREAKNELWSFLQFF